MKIGFHHVGKQGAHTDFPKTVFNQITIDFVEENIPDSIVSKKIIIDNLKQKFPDGKVNCWGVPSGAKAVIKNLQQGDFILLVESASISGGRIPAICKVDFYLPVELWDLSNALWGTDKFPFIFFFKTILIELKWVDFIESIDYKANFRPAGNFYIVKKERFGKYGGEESYINELVKNNVLEESFVEYNPVQNVSQEQREIQNIEQGLDNSEELSNTEKESIVKVRIGQSMFRKKLILKYKKCVLCGMDKKEILIASHIKPWSQSNNYEKLDLENGLLLCPHHDSLFDKKYISFDAEGFLHISEEISNINREFLNINTNMRIVLSNRQKQYMEWHHKMFKSFASEIGLVVS